MTKDEQLAALNATARTLTASFISGDLSTEAREAARAELADVRTQILRLVNPDDGRVFP